MTTDDTRTTATGHVWLDHLTLPYWWALEQYQLLQLDRHMGIRGPWWRRPAKRRRFWAAIASAVEEPRGPGRLA